MAVGKDIGRFAIKLLAAFVIAATGLFWSLVVIVGGLVYGCKKGFRQLFSSRDRCKESPPFHYTAWDKESRNSPGPNTKPWNHGYITVPASGMRFHFVYSGKVPSHIAISDIDGETVIMREDANDNKAGDEPELMLCLHGFPENWFSWRYLLRYFDDPPSEVDNYFVVAIDLRGYGDSDKPATAGDYHLNALVSDVRGIAQQLGYKKFVLVGHDWGGLISWSVAQIHPEILEKCIIISCPYVKAFAETVTKRPQQLVKMWYALFFQIPFLPELFTSLSDHMILDVCLNGSTSGIQNPENRLTGAELEVFKYSLRNSMTCPLNYYRAAIWPFCPSQPLHYPRLRTTGKRLHGVPILLLWGGQDKFLDKSMAENSRKYLNPDNGSKVIVVEAASHWLQQDAPHETIKHITDFISSQ